MNTQLVYNNIVSLFKEEFCSSLTGIYLHGSMAMGCFNPAHSDIDLLILVKDKHTIETYKRIAIKLIQLEKEMRLLKGIELSIVLDTYADEFVYPTPFEFHYSAFHREKYRNDPEYYCGGYTDPDLAAHFVVTYDRGIVLYGKFIKDVFKPVNKQYYIDAIKYDVLDALEKIVDDPVYYVLNLSRALLFLKEGLISSKREGGEWAVNVIPIKYVDLVQLSLARYNGETASIEASDHMLIEFAQYMLNEIEESISQAINT